jgi:uncharacterized protein
MRKLGSPAVRIMSRDLSDIASVHDVYDTLSRERITVDVLVNNAGVGEFGFFAETDWNKEAEMIHLNITALTLLTKLFVKGMIVRKSGRILNVASTASFQPGPLMSVYYATKAYVLYFSEGIANELEGTGITVTALCPGPTASGFQAAAALEESKLVKGKNLPTSAEVAEYGYKALMDGKVVAIHGAMNWIMAQSVRFTPRAMVRSLVRSLSERSA